MHRERRDILGNFCGEMQMEMGKFFRHVCGGGVSILSVLEGNPKISFVHAFEISICAIYGCVDSFSSSSAAAKVSSEPIGGTFSKEENFSFSLFHRQGSGKRTGGRTKNYFGELRRKQRHLFSSSVFFFWCILFFFFSFFFLVLFVLSKKEDEEGSLFLSPPPHREFSPGSCYFRIRPQSKRRGRVFFGEHKRAIW